MRITLDSFRNVIQLSELVDDDVLQTKSAEFDALVEKEASDSGELAKASAKRFAQFLVEQKVLSVWQAENLLKGKHKGFRLGKYRLISLLGKGGMSSVYLAEHTVMKRRVAIKVLPHKKVNDASYLGRFHREAQAVAALDHPNIVRAYDVDAETEGSMEIHFLVMEYVEGKSLHELVAKKGTLPPREAADYIRQAADGLEHAHVAGLVHRDIKPGNLLVDTQGVVKLLDLGLARFFNDEENSLTVEHDEKVLGTADYLAPEQAVDSHTVDHRADLYSLGCTLYFLLTGEPPFNQGSLAQRLIAHQTKEPPSILDARDDVPESLIELMKRLMSKDRDDRPDTAGQAAQEFADWLDATDDAKAKSADAAPVAIDSNDGGQDELGSFLSQLDSQPKLSSGVDVATSSRVGPLGDSNVAGAAANTTKSTGQSSNIHGRGPSSIIGRQKKSIPLSYVIGGGAGLVALVGLIWFFTSGGDSADRPQQVVIEGSGESATGGGGTQVSARPPVQGDTITVGTEGNFATVAEAIAYVTKYFTPFSNEESRTIQLAAGETFNETISLDSSGLDQFPRFVTLTTDSLKPATIRGDGQTSVLAIDSVNQFTISNVVLDAAGARSAIVIRGYAGGSAIRDVVATGFTGAGVEMTGAAGISGQQILLAGVTIKPSEGQTPSAGIKLVSSIPETSRIRIERCRLQGPMRAGVEVVGPASEVVVVRTVFDGTQVGVSFPGGGAEFDRVNLIGNTFHDLQVGVVFSEQPAASSKRMAIAQNLFTDVDKELVVQSGLKREQLAKLFKDGGWFSENFATRSKPASLADDEFRIVNDDGYSLSDAQYVSTDRGADDYLKPKAGKLKSAKGGPDPKHIGAISPAS